MPDKLYKILLILGAAFLLTLALFVYSWHPDKRLEVDFLNVGQGDAMLIRAPEGQNVLIDGGPDKSVLRQLGLSLWFWERNIDLMVLTHPHDDHVAGENEAMKKYAIGKILYTGAAHTAPNYLAWLGLVKNKKIPITIIDRPQKIRLGKDCDLEIIYPFDSFLNKTVPDLNDTSIIIKLTYGRKKFLFMGDASAKVERELLDKKIDVAADVIKIGHHGSDYSSSEEFLAAVHPQIAVIEVGKDNKFGHPSGRVVKRLERLGVRVYRTDLDGLVKLWSDGERVELGL